MSAHIPPSSTTAVPQPPLPCLRCGYDLTGITHPICPECAAVITDDTYRVINLRNQLLQQRRRILRRTIAVPFGGMAVCFTGLPMLILLHAAQQIFDIYTLIEITISAAFGVGCIVGFGFLSLLLVMIDQRRPTKDLRTLALLLWLKHLWLLHTPWLMIPAFAAVLGGIALVIPGSHTFLRVLAALFFCVWVILCLIAYTIWVRRRYRDLAALHLLDHARFDLAVALAFLTFLGAGALGLLGGAVATLAITDPGGFS